MAGARLRRPVRSEREDETAGERSSGAETERAQPEKHEPSRPEVAEEHERVPGDDRPERRVERAEDDAERPAGEVDALLGLGLEAVRVAPGVLAALNLVAGEPQLPDGLEMVSWGRGAGSALQPLGKEVRAGVAQRRPCRDDAGREEDDYDESDNARAAESSSSTSGTSPSS